MAVKRGRIITVEGCPCEVVEENVELGIVWSSGDADAWPGEPRPLVVAPDGSFVLLNPFDTSMVSTVQPDRDATIRRLAKAVQEDA